MKKDEKNSVSPVALLAFAMILIAVVAFALLRNKTEQVSTTPDAPPSVSEQPTPPVEQKADFQMPPYHETVQRGMLPPVKDPATVPAAAQAAYLVAQKNPELIAQLPCFCYCDRFGHKSLHDCFVSDHAVSCDICLKEALQANQMVEEGLAPAEVREAIVAQFHPRDHGHDHEHDHDH